MEGGRLRTSRNALDIGVVFEHAIHPNVFLEFANQGLDNLPRHVIGTEATQRALVSPMERRACPIDDYCFHRPTTEFSQITIDQWSGCCKVGNRGVHERHDTRSSDTMIRECTNHGYYADDHLCPACNEEGRFIMRTGERDSMARRLALVLRHAPEKFDLEMDINGWIDVKDIVKQFKGSNERRNHWLRPITSEPFQRPIQKVGTRSEGT